MELITAFVMRFLGLNVSVEMEKDSEHHANNQLQFAAGGFLVIGFQ